MEYLSRLFNNKESENKKEKIFSMERLDRLEKVMYEDIDAAFENIENREVAIAKIQRVFEHSINDGIRLGQKYRLTATEWKKIINSDEVAFKHPEILKKISTRIQKIAKDTEYKDEVMQWSQDISERISPNTIENRANTISQKEHKHAMFIDDYYTEVLQQSDKKIEPSPQTGTPYDRYTGTDNERKAKEYLAKIQPWIEGQYYPGRVLSHIYKKIDDEAKKELIASVYKANEYDMSFQEYVQHIPHNNDEQIKIALQYVREMLPHNEEVFLEFARASLVSQSAMNTLKKTLPEGTTNDMRDVQHQKLNMVYDIQRKEVEKPLLEEVRARIRKEKGQDFSVEFNHQIGAYEIVDHKAKERAINEKDRREMVIVAQAFNDEIQKLKNKSPDSFNPLEISLDESDLNKDAQKSINYLGERIHIIPEKEFFKTVLDTAGDEFSIKYIHENIHGLVHNGQAQFAITKLQNTQYKNETYIKDLIKKIHDESQEYEKSQKQITEETIAHLGSYQNVDNITNINGEIAFRAELEDGTRAAFLNGKQIGEAYQNVNYITDINGELAFRATLEDGTRAAFLNGKQIGEAYQYVDDITDINGEIAFRATLEDGTYAAFLNGKQIGEAYQSIFDITEHKDGVMLYVADGGAIKKIIIPTNPLDNIEYTLSILNTIHNPDIENIRKIIGNNEKKKPSFLEEIKQELSSNWSFVKYATQMMKKSPKEFLTLNAIKKTRAQNHAVLQLQKLTFPEVYNASQKERKYEGGSLLNWMKGEENNSTSLKAVIADYLGMNQERIGYQGGNPSEMKTGEPQVVLSTEEPLYQKYVGMGYYAKEKDGQWGKSYIPFDVTPSRMSRENTITTAIARTGSLVNLPLPVHSYYIKDKIYALSKDGKKTPLELKLDSFGYGKVRLPLGAERIVYSIQESSLRETPRDLDVFEFEVLKKNILDQDTGGDYFEKVPGMSEQDMLFIKSIESQSPKEKIIAIEKYVQEIGYYDFNNNDEVVGPKRNANSEELFYLMEDRMNELRGKLGPVYNKINSKKRYAGVCDDFSKLTTALLREAGIPSGVMTCFRAGPDTDITVDQAHAASFVLWRGAHGNITPYIIDGTPVGITEQERAMQLELGVDPQSIEEKEKENEEILKQTYQEAEKELAKIEALLKDGSSDSLTQLETDKLEYVLNTILTHDVDWKHVRSLDAMVNAYRFTPLHKEIDTLDPSVAVDFLKRSTKSIVSNDEYARQYSGSAGTALFDVAKNFIKKENENSRAGEDSFKKMIDMLESSLTKSEYRALSVIAQYMKVQKQTNT